jgi:hypothetical protein
MALELSHRRSRRSLLTGVAGVVAGAAAATMASAQSVFAAGDDGKAIHVGDNDADVRSTTTLRNTKNGRTLISMHSGGSGTGVYGASQSGVGVHGFSAKDIGVQGVAHGERGVGVWAAATSGTGVYAQSTSGFALVAQSTSASGVYATSDSTSAIYSQSGSTSDPALVSWGKGHSTGVQGISGGSTLPASPPNTGVFGTAAGSSAVGVLGSSASGRGGQFSGGAANVQLTPSGAASHPSTGSAGDVFVDKSHRLWFCKGGNTWVKLA